MGSTGVSPGKLRGHAWHGLLLLTFTLSLNLSGVFRNMRVATNRRAARLVTLRNDGGNERRPCYTSNAAHRALAIRIDEQTFAEGCGHKRPVGRCEVRRVKSS